jgi:hypothetical protein
MSSRPFCVLAAVLFAVPALAGEVRGVIRFKGSPPSLPPLKVTKDTAHCGDSVPDESVVVADGRLRNVVVSVDAKPVPRPAPGTVVLDQHGCRYIPHVQVAPAGSSLEIRNGDPMLHNIHGRMGQQTVFNVAMPLQGMRVPRPLAKEGVVHVQCDVHAWMDGWVVVTDQPSAVNGADGAYVITGVPAGTWTVTAWHERYGKRALKVTVPASGEATADFTFGP